MRMKLGRTALLVLGIGVFVIAFVTLFFIYARQSSEQEELEATLAGAQTQFAKLISGKDALESLLTQQQSTLAEARALLTSSQASFPELEASIEYDEVLTEIADSYGLEVLNMSADEPRDKEIEGITFVVISFEVEVQGAVNSVLSMVSKIATDERFASATVESVNIKVPRRDPLATAPEPEEPTATIKLTGYSYGGG
jgi:hypothetical protein